MNAELASKIEIKSTTNPQYNSILSPEALRFLEALHLRFEDKRQKLLRARPVLQEAISNGKFPTFPEETKQQRLDSWEVGPIPKDLQKRHVEITGPVDRKMIINALNSGANCFMADFEDSTSPTWDNVVSGQLNLRDAINKNIDFVNEKGKAYKLNKEIATLQVRPRGWHLNEKHLCIEGREISASLFDFGLYFFHNASTLIKNGSGPYFYLPKIESYQEARLWNEVFVFAQEYLNIPKGTIKATVLIETILAAFQMDEIIYELKDHMAGLNAGRWDYIFSVIKKFRTFDEFVLPDRHFVGMQAPFMRSYAELLVYTCHRRGAHAMGGMSAFIPSKDESINEVAFEKVRKDKKREANQGYDGTWVAHPGLVDLAREEFLAVLGTTDHQKDVLGSGKNVQEADLLAINKTEGEITEDGVSTNINVGILYIESWLNGVGAAALYNLMEDAATAEISRAQIWQWRFRGKKTSSGKTIDQAYLINAIDAEMKKIKEMVGEERFTSGKYDEAASMFANLVLKDDFVDFLTLPAYQLLD